MFSIFLRYLLHVIWEYFYDLKDLLGWLSIELLKFLKENKIIFIMFVGLIVKIKLVNNIIKSKIIHDFKFTRLLVTIKLCTPIQL